MKVERIQALPLTKEQTLEYAKRVVGQKLGKTAEKVGYLGGGSFGRAASVKCKDGQKLVVKFLRTKGMMQKETHDLKLLAKYSAVKVPDVLFTRLGDSEIPVDCYGMEQIEGKSSLFALGMLFLGKKRRKQFADQVTARSGCFSSAKNAENNLPTKSLRRYTPSIPAKTTSSATR